MTTTVVDDIGLLVTNALCLGSFWPFAVGLSYQVALALFNFFGLLQRAMPERDAT